MYVYKRTEFSPYCLYTVGFYEPSGKWIAESDYDNAGEAASRAALLNGSSEETIDKLINALKDFCDLRTALSDDQFNNAYHNASKLIQSIK